MSLWRNNWNPKTQFNLPSDSMTSYPQHVSHMCYSNSTKSTMNSLKPTIRPRPSGMLLLAASGQRLLTA